MHHKLATLQHQIRLHPSTFYSGDHSLLTTIPEVDGADCTSTSTVKVSCVGHQDLGTNLIWLVSAQISGLPVGCIFGTVQFNLTSWI